MKYAHKKQGKKPEKYIKIQHKYKYQLSKIQETAWPDLLDLFLFP